jgi:hypothetical protein
VTPLTAVVTSSVMLADVTVVDVLIDEVFHSISASSADVPRTFSVVLVLKFVVGLAALM